MKRKIFILGLLCFVFTNQAMNYSRVEYTDEQIRQKTKLMDSTKFEDMVICAEELKGIQLGSIDDGILLEKIIAAVGYAVDLRNFAKERTKDTVTDMVVNSELYNLSLSYLVGFFKFYDGRFKSHVEALEKSCSAQIRPQVSELSEKLRNFNKQS